MKPIIAEPASPASIASLALCSWMTCRRAADTIVPVLVPVMVAFAAGTGLKSMWGMPMLALAGLLAIALAGSRFSRRSLERIARAAGVLLLLVPFGYAIDTVWESSLTGQMKRQSWPQTEISERLTRRWVEATQKPLGIVAGERWVAGIVALSGQSMPSILTLGDLTLAPWITPERLSTQGALVVWQELPELPGPPAYLVPLIGQAPLGREQFPWPRFPHAAPLIIGYAILPPGQATAVSANPPAAP